MKKILIFGSLSRSIRNSRIDLLDELINNKYNVVVYLRTKDRLTKNILKKKKIKYYENKLSKNIFHSSIIIDIYILLKIIFKEKPQIVFTYNTSANFLNILLKFFFNKIKSVVFITGLGNIYIDRNKKKYQYFFFKFLCKKIINLSELIIFQNIDDYKFFKQIDRIKSYIITNGSGVNIKKFSSNIHPSKKIIVTMISKLIPQKGVLEYFNAIKKVKIKNKLINFKFIGPKELYLNLNKKLDELIEKKYIEHIDFTENIKTQIEKSSIIILPSYREGTPRSLLEAMSMSRPIVTTNVPGCKEVVINGYNGFIIKKKSANDLANKILDLASDYKKLINMGKNSRKLVKKKFNSIKVSRDIVKYLNDNN